MRKIIIAAAAGLLALGALPAAAGPAPQERPYGTGPMNGQTNSQDHMNGPGRGNGGDPHMNGHGRDDDRWGTWNTGWGARPPAPPRHWTRQADWYRHARACQIRYRSYNPRTDTFTVRRGVVNRCRL